MSAAAPKIDNLFGAAVIWLNQVVRLVVERIMLKLVTATALILLAVSPILGAQENGPPPNQPIDSTANQSSDVSPNAPETPVVSGGSQLPIEGELVEEDYGFLGAPSWVLLRSFLVPAWGQVHNRAWIKALVVAGIEGAMIERLLYERRRVHHYRALAYERPLEADYYFAKERRHRLHRRDFIWWTSLFVFMSMWDAYVDAHLKFLDVDLQTDPEIFQDPENDTQPALSLRLSLRTNF